MENLGALRDKIKNGIKSTMLILYGRSDVYKNQVTVTEEENMWKRYEAEDMIEYFKIFHRCTESKFSFSAADMKLPVYFCFKGLDTYITRGLKADLTLNEAMEQTFSHMFSSGKLTQKYEQVVVRIAGWTVPWDTNVMYLYDTFKGVDGVLYLTIVV